MGFFRSNRLRALIGSLAIASLTACTQEAPDLNDVSRVGNFDLAAIPNQLLQPNEEMLELRAPANPDRNAYFGDLHVHTAYSFDAYAFGTIATPYDAYRYARGEPLQHPTGYKVQLQQPLDFLRGY